MLGRPLPSRCLILTKGWRFWEHVDFVSPRLPLDTTWQAAFGQVRWPTKLLPEVLGSAELTLAALIHEYLFVSLFKACAESLASENTCRLAAMQRAQRNIDDLLEQLHIVFNQTRQTSIDEELFDLISGFEALAGGEVGVRSER